MLESLVAAVPLPALAIWSVLLVVGLTVLVSDTTATFNWQYGQDEETPADGLTYNLRVGTSDGLWDIMEAPALADGTLLAPIAGHTRQN